VHPARDLGSVAAINGTFRGSWAFQARPLAFTGVDPTGRQIARGTEFAGYADGSR
jgi:hypothetical protein